jgi:hexulose-6-phosphate isomerase
MIKSISYWSFPGGLENTASYPEVFRRAKALGFEAVEAAVSDSGELTPESDEAKCREVARAASEAGVRISSVATGLFWSHSLSSADEAERKRAIEATKGMCRVARALGTDAVLVVPGAVDVFFLTDFPVVSYDDVYKRAAKSIRACLPAAKKYKVKLCFENVWNKFLLSPLEMKAFIDGFKSPLVKCYFDVGNVIPFGYPEHWIRILGKRIGRVHFKDLKWRFMGDASAMPGLAEFAKGFCGAAVAAFCDLGEGDVNFAEVVKALREAKYDGPVTGEMIPPAEGLLERTSAAMDVILGRA